LVFNLTASTTYYYSVSYKHSDYSVVLPADYATLSDSDGANQFEKAAFKTFSSDKPDLLLKITRKDLVNANFDLQILSLAAPAHDFKIIDLNFNVPGYSLKSVSSPMVDPPATVTLNYQKPGADPTPLLVRINFEYKDMRNNRITGNSAWLRLQ